MDLPGHRTIDVLHYIEELFPVNDIANYIYGRKFIFRPSLRPRPTTQGFMARDRVDALRQISGSHTLNTFIHPPTCHKVKYLKCTHMLTYLANYDMATAE